MRKIKIILNLILIGFSIYVAYLCIALYINCSLDIKYIATSLSDIKFAFFCSKIYLLYLLFLSSYFFIKQMIKNR
jgi:hypothetical protein